MWPLQHNLNISVKKRQHSQLIQTVCGLLQSLSFKKVVINLMVLDAGVWRHASGSDLPHGDAESPLRDTEY